MHFLSCLPHLNAKQASFFQFSASSILAEDRVGAQVNWKLGNSNLSKTSVFYLDFAWQIDSGLQWKLFLENPNFYKLLLDLRK